MAAVADLERLLERVFERTSARIFRSRVQLVQAEHRVERAMEAGRTGRGASTVVPNRFRVRLHPADLDDLAGRSGGPEVLAARLADSALAFARLHAYHLPARPTVSVVADPIVERGTVEVDASVMRSAPTPASPAVASAVATETPAPDVARVAPVEVDDLAGLVAAVPSGQPPVATDEADLEPKVERELQMTAEPDREPGVPAEPERGPDAPVAALEVPRIPVVVPLAPPADAMAGPVLRPPVLPPFAPAHPAAPGLRNASDRPYSVRPAVPAPAQALLRVSEPGGRESVLYVEGRPLTLGRAHDNDLVIVDSRVSRHHGRFQTRHGTLVYTDLGSTNGTRVNGIRVDDIVLGAGDRLQVGDVVVVVEQLPH